VVIEAGSLLKTVGSSGESELAAVTCTRQARAACRLEILAGIGGPARRTRISAAAVGEIDLAESFPASGRLLDADAMLAGQHAAEFRRKPEDIRAEAPPAPSRRACGSYRISGWQIAVAGVKHMATRKSYFPDSSRIAPRLPAIFPRGMVPSMQR